VPVRLDPAHEAAFAAAVPAWAWLGWGSPGACLERGAGFGLFQGPELASAAWILEEDEHLAAIGVATVSRYQRLGLARAVAAALVDHLQRVRRRTPLWGTTSDNTASLALAEGLSFSLARDERLLRCR
jgi:RimJ/RimL family protein N-acetyltransferase